MITISQKKYFYLAICRCNIFISNKELIKIFCLSNKELKQNGR